VKPNQHKRIFGLDVFRGWAIVMMIVFHFSYDLWYFHLADIDIIHGTFWIYFRYLIVSIFLISAGVSLAVVHTPRIRWNKVARRAMILGIAAAAVTVATRIQAPRSWVYFGILHLIWVASLAGLVFVRRPWIALVSALLVFAGSYNDGVLWQAQHQFYTWAAPLLHLPRYTEDLARFFPWFGAVLMGIAGYGFGWHRRVFGSVFLSAPNSFNKALAFLGRHALVIYLIHLPILFGIVMAAARY